jgi:hypothetical protein
MQRMNIDLYVNVKSLKIGVSESKVFLIQK